MSVITDIERTIEQLKERQAKARKFEKLMNNREFKELILGDYLCDEPARITTLLAYPQHRESSVSQLMAISRFNEYLDQLHNRYTSVDEELEAALESRAQVLAEEA